MVKSDPNKQETDPSSFQGSSVAGTKFEPFGPGAWVQKGRRTLLPTHPTPHFPAQHPSGPAPSAGDVGSQAWHIRGLAAGTAAAQ